LPELVDHRDARDAGDPQRRLADSGRLFQESREERHAEAGVSEQSGVPDGFQNDLAKIRQADRRK
jgi:hypothetical protein